jgi:hypothetical protein
MADEQTDDGGQATRVDNPLVDPYGETTEQPAVAAPAPAADPVSYRAWDKGPSPAEAQRRADEAKAAYAEKPHLFVAAAFAGGFLAAQLLKHLGGGDD